MNTTSILTIFNWLSLSFEISMRVENEWLIKKTLSKLWFYFTSQFFKVFLENQFLYILEPCDQFKWFSLQDVQCQIHKKLWIGTARDKQRHSNF